VQGHICTIIFPSKNKLPTMGCYHYFNNYLSIFRFFFFMLTHNRVIGSLCVANTSKKLSRSWFLPQRAPEKELEHFPIQFWRTACGQAVIRTAWQKRWSIYPASPHPDVGRKLWGRGLDNSPPTQVAITYPVYIYIYLYIYIYIYLCFYLGRDQ
jgi:hypothetical protein